MQNIYIEYNGTKQPITKNQLLQLAANGRIRSDTVLWVGETRTVCGKVRGIVFGKPSTQNSDLFPQETDLSSDDEMDDLTVLTEAGKFAIREHFSLFVVVGLITVLLLFYLYHLNSRSFQIAEPDLPQAVANAPEAAPSAEENSVKEPEAVPVAEENSVKEPEASPSAEENSVKEPETKTEKSEEIVPQKEFFMEDGTLAESFDPNLTKLPYNFAPHDFMTIVNALLQKLESPRGEFETTAKYKERIKDAKNSPLFGKVNLNSTFVIRTAC